ncbi:MAG TPA: hypothetical protein VIG72_02075 [Pontibacter sp.]
MKRILLLITLLTAWSTITYAQKYTVELQLGFWADSVQQPEIKPIITLYKNYLESHPDSLYDNPYWNEAEKQKYRDFDFTRNSIFQEGGWSAKSLYNSFTPHLLKVEKRDSVYLIQAMLYSAKADVAWQKFNPILIHRYYAVKEGEDWKLANAITYDTEDWKTISTKYIDFHFSRSKYYSDTLAALSNSFCDTIIKRFNFTPPTQKVAYYVADGVHEVGRLLGYDHYIYGFAYGKTIENIIISGNGTVYYPHELVHQFSNNHPERGGIIEEGFATWLGGSMGKSYDELARQYASEYRSNRGASFEWAWQCPINCYPFAAIIFDLLHEYTGDKGVAAFLKLPSRNVEETYSAIRKVTGWNKKEFLRKWATKMMLLSSNT